MLWIRTAEIPLGWCFGLMMLTSQLGFIVNETQVLQLFIAKYEGLMRGISLQNILADVIYFILIDLCYL